MKHPIDDRADVGAPGGAEDPRSTAELVDIYVDDPESDEAIDVLAVLHERGGEEEFAAGRELVTSDDPEERMAGADLLGGLGLDDRTFLEASVELLLPLLQDADPEVVQAAAIALGHRGSPRAIEPLLELVGHPDPDVRIGVAFGLAPFETPAVTEALITLMSDSDLDTRDWATYALGSQSDADSPAVRQALRARLAEGDPEIRGEALIGLARRDDRSILGQLHAELAGPLEGEWAIEAAGFLGEPSLVPTLEALLLRLSPEDVEAFGPAVEEAIEACLAGTAANDGELPA